LQSHFHKLQAGRQFNMHNKPALEAEVFAYLNNLEVKLSYILGVGDIVEGQKPQGASGIAVQLLQKQGMSRFGIVAKKLQDAVIQSANMLVACVKANYSEEFIAKILQDPELIMAFGALSVSDIIDGMKLEEYTNVAVAGMRRRSFAEALQFFQMGLATPEDVMQFSDHPLRDTIMKRMRSQGGAGMPGQGGNLIQNQMGAQQAGGQAGGMISQKNPTAGSFAELMRGVT